MYTLTRWKFSYKGVWVSVYCSYSKVSIIFCMYVLVFRAFVLLLKVLSLKYNASLTLCIHSYIHFLSDDSLFM